MLIQLIVDCDPVEAGKYSECQALIKALDHYKCDVGLTSDDPTLVYVLDTLQHKVALSLVSNVEQLSIEGGEPPFA